jgi:alpha-tubulin suppressor-like RCC1 family protein
MSTPTALVQKLCNYCNILRDDGLSYGNYVEQLTFLLFLKMADEQSRPPFNKPSPIPKGKNGRVLLACLFIVTGLALFGTSRAAGAPQITLSGPDPITNECHNTFVDPGASITDVPVAIGAGWSHSLALKADGSVVAWGANFAGQTNVPANLGDVVAVSANGLFSLALTGDGTVVAWGDGTYEQTNIPSSATNVVAIAAGGYHALALRADGSVVGWGNNPIGQINIPDRATNIVAIAGGREFSVALQADGTVIAWGFSQFGVTNILASVSNVTAIAAGDHHVLALRADGTVVTWGYDNLFGAMRVPERATNVVAIAARDFISMALRADGTLAVWGQDDRGRVTAIPGDATNVVGIAVGGDLGGSFCLALKADGSVVGWGEDGLGQTSAPSDLTNLNLPYVVTGTVNRWLPGSYTLTYTVTNVLGESGMATRTVIVADTTPPHLIFPSNVAVDCTGKDGVVIYDFDLIAWDDCSLTALTCDWRTGNAFPIGTTSVTCVATDLAGNATRCSFEVTVRGPLSVKAAVLQEMEVVQAAIEPKRSPELNKAVARLRRAIRTEGWVDEIHLAPRNARMFLDEAFAVRHLRELLRSPRNGLPFDTVMPWILRLRASDRILIRLQIDEAIEAGVAPKQIERASRRFNTAALTAAEHPIRATLLYKDAWRIVARPLILSHADE